MVTPERGLSVARLIFAVAMVLPGLSSPAFAQWDPASFACSDPPEGLAGYVGQSSCIWAEQPGVAAFREEILDSFPVTTDLGIKRACGSGGKSEHKEGRAWDWGVKSWVSSQKAIADGVLAALLDTDGCGQEHALARRLGVMYMIWDEHIWRAYKPWLGWQPYTGSNPHTDHVHFSFSWPGALEETSYWTDGQAAPPGQEEQPVCTPAPVAGAEGSFFKDMVPGSLGYEAALLLAQAGISNGCSNDPKLFCGDCPTSRYQAVVFLLRAMGVDIPDPPATPSFDDVPVDAWWLRYVEHAKTLGITSGCGPKLFCPHDPVTRGQMAKFVVISAGWSNVNPATPTFADVPKAHVFYKAIETLKDKCVTNGCGDGTGYCPDDLVPRRHAALFIARAFDLGDTNSCLDYCDPSTCAEGGWCDAWGTCGGFADACDETGTHTRTCHDFTSCQSDSLDPTCGATQAQESGGCVRDTDGDVVAGWSAWTACSAGSAGRVNGSGDPGSGGACQVQGTQTRTRTVCSAGAAVAETQSQACAVPVACPEPDPEPDAGPDPGADAGPDPGADAGPDSGADAGPDAGADPVPDAGPDPSVDADPEPVTDTGPEPEPEVGSEPVQDTAGSETDPDPDVPRGAGPDLPAPDAGTVPDVPATPDAPGAAGSDPGGPGPGLGDVARVQSPGVGAVATVASNTSRSKGCASGTTPGQAWWLLGILLFVRSRRRRQEVL